MKSLNINIIVSIACIFNSFGLSIFFNINTKTKIISLGIGATIIIWVWIFYFINHYPSSKEVADKETGQTKTKTLHELFLSDFEKTHILSDYHLTKNNKVVYSIKYIIWGDFDTKTLFFSIFLPKSDYTYNACMFLIPKYKEILSGEIRTVMKAMKHHPPGSKVESWDELNFSGRVYVYHETYLLPERIKSLVEEYKKEGLSPQFRGRDYLIMRNSPLYEQ